MGYMYYACGCVICTSMFGERPVMGVWHCSGHEHIHDDEQSLSEQAATLREVISGELRQANG